MHCGDYGLLVENKHSGFISTQDVAFNAHVSKNTIQRTQRYQISVEVSRPMIILLFYYYYNIYYILSLKSRTQLKSPLIHNTEVRYSFSS